MKTLFFRSAFTLLNLVAFTLVVTDSPVRAEVSTSVPLQSSESEATSLPSEVVPPTLNRQLNALSPEQQDSTLKPSLSAQPGDPLILVPTTSSVRVDEFAKTPEKGEDAQSPKLATPLQEVPNLAAKTSASDLLGRPTVAQTVEAEAETSAKPKEKVAQTISPGRATQSGSSYVGIAGNIGFGGETKLGSGAFAVVSKIGLTRNISVRPTAFLFSDPTLIVPVTYDFTPRQVEETTINAAPYVGAGLGIGTGDETSIGLVLSGGVDIPLSRTFTATAGLNIGFIDDAEVGLLIGIGYNFPNREE